MSSPSLPEKSQAVRAYAALQAGAALEPWTYQPGSLGANEVEVDVTHCGVCHTDLHLINNDFGISSFPLVPGHEVVGVISAVGSGVQGRAVGQRVGIGWQRGTCLQCEWCERGLHNLCAQSRPTCLAGYGGFAQKLRVDSLFAVPVPETLDSAIAAPLLCAGITVYAPLRRLAHPGSRVGVIGIGGLGHLAVQFARAMGAEVFAFSTSENKRQEAESFGAHHFVLSTDPQQMKRASGSLDVLLSTATADLDWASWLGTLRPNGAFCVVGASPGPITLPVIPMIFGQYSVTASVIGPPAQIEDMFRFAALHRVRTAVEIVPLEQVNTALEKVRRNEARYRMVLAC